MLDLAEARLQTQAAQQKPVANPDECAAETKIDGMPTSAVERHLRRMLCFQRHGARAYMDDGEASWSGGDNHRAIDYMRETPEAIEKAWRDAGEKTLAAQDDPCPSCPKGQACRTPNCGRLKLPTDHPYRSKQPKQEDWGCGPHEYHSLPAFNHKEEANKALRDAQNHSYKIAKEYNRKENT